MEKKFPDLSELSKSLEGSRLERELTSTFQRLYDYVDDLERRLAASIEKESKLTVQRFQSTSQLVNTFATQLIGLTNPPNPLQELGVGNGTVTDITAGAGLSGGTINQSGTIVLIIGTNDVIQKSDGSQLIDSAISEVAGVSVNIDIPLLNLGNGLVRGIIDDANALITLGRTGRVELFIDTTNQVVIITDMPLADPGISGALWNNAGVVNISP